MPSAHARLPTAPGPHPHTPTAAPPRVAARIADSRDQPLRLLHAGRDAAYLAVESHDGEWCLGIAASGAVQVPLALRVSAPSLSGWDWTRARILDGVVRIGTRSLAVGRLIDVRVPRSASGGAGSGPEGPDEASAAALVDARIGRGPGLTPAGDDWLCGWLAARRSRRTDTAAVDARIRAQLRRTTTLSAGLLECALAGEAIPQVAAWITSVGTADESAAEAAVVGVGHTSGRALLAGLHSGIDRAEAAA